MHAPSSHTRNPDCLPSTTPVNNAKSCLHASIKEVYHRERKGSARWSKKFDDALPGLSCRLARLVPIPYPARRLPCYVKQ